MFSLFLFPFISYFPLRFKFLSKIGKAIEPKCFSLVEELKWKKSVQSANNKTKALEAAEDEDDVDDKWET